MESINFHSRLYPEDIEFMFEVAGLLTYLPRNVFPSFDSDLSTPGLVRLTAAGTVQDSHLIPFYDGKRKLPTYHFGDKGIKKSEPRQKDEKKQKNDKPWNYSLPELPFDMLGNHLLKRSYSLT